VRTTTSFDGQTSGSLPPSEDVVDDARPIPFLCECVDPDCRSTVELSINQFRDVREVDKRYAIVTGHPTMNGERPVEVDGDVTIVQTP
jgi:hypothetical protein